MNEIEVDLDQNLKQIELQFSEEKEGQGKDCLRHRQIDETH